MWTGGIATAIVAALVAFVGVLNIRGVFGVAVIAPENTPGTIDYLGAMWVAGFAAGGTLLATALAHVLLLIAPRPMVFFWWIVGLVTVVLVVWPFNLAVAVEVQVANAALYLVIAVAISSSLASSAHASVRLPPDHGWQERGWRARS
ncbi:hypothetical protein GCM10027436_73350 [Actinophytocola sediminis]